MKKFISILLLLVLMLPLSSGVNALAATEKALSTREKAIANAYVKSYENGNLSSLKKYIYSGSKIKIDSVSSTSNVKIFSSTYTKKYDANVKMNSILISCIVVVSDSNNLTLYKGTIGLNLITKNKTVYVYSKNTTMTKLDQITKYDLTETQANDIATYILNKYGESPVANISLSYQKALSATKAAPADFGSTYIYNGKYNYTKDNVIGTFAITINTVADSTLEEALSRGYKGPSNELIEYKLVNITWDVIKAEVTKGTGSIYTYRDFMAPMIRGSEVPGLDYINAFIDNGFADNFKSKLDEFKDYKSRSATSFSVTGNVILPVIKNEENYMVFIVKGEEDPALDRIFFKLNN